MSETRPARRLWINLGEGAAVLAVVISALSYWDAHREHSVAEQQAVSQARAATAFVLTGAADDGGRRLTLAPLRPTQAIQSETFLFPRQVRHDPVEVTAARPRIEADWVGPGLGRLLDGARAGSRGEGDLPVAIVTTYVEDGAMRADRSLYRVGYAWQSRFLLGRRISLEGLSLIERGFSGDPRSVVDRRWAADHGSAPAGGSPSRR